MSCDNFLYEGLQGHALRARRGRSGPGRFRTERDALREFVKRWEMGRQEPGGAAGLLGSSGAVGCPRPASGSPPVTGATAAPMPRTRRQAAQAVTFPQRRARTDGRAVLHAPGSLLPRKITIKGVPTARHRYAAQTLDTDLPRQDLGTCQEDGGRVAAFNSSGEHREGISG